MQENSKMDWPRLDAATLGRLRVRRPALAFGLLALNLGIYAGLSTLSLLLHAWWASFIALPLQALILCGLFSVVHDCVHNSVLRSSLGNRVLGTTLATLLLTNFTLYKSFHIEHHANTTLESDPEGTRRFSRPRDYIVFLLSVSFFLAMWRQTYQAVVGKLPAFVKESKLRREILVDGFLLLSWLSVSVILSAVAPRVFAVAYLLPLAVFFPLMNLTSLPEHFATRTGRSVIGNTRSTDSNPVFSLLFWYNNLHAEHHAYPSIPAYNLPQVRQAIGHLFLFRERSYIRFHVRLVANLWRTRQRHDID